MDQPTVVVTEVGKHLTKDGYMDVEMQRHSSGLWIRPGSSDLAMIKDCLVNDYQTVDCKDHTVLDLGGNIGGFVLKAAREGVKKIVSYEPEPNNFKVLERNIAVLRDEYDVDSTAVEAAIGHEAGTFDLIIVPGSNSGCSASLNIKARKDRKSVPVRVERFLDVVEDLQPSLVKMDIEGAEYPLLNGYIPSCVKEMAIELHGFSKANEELMHSTWAKLSSEWKVVEHQTKVAFQKVCLMTAHIVRK